MTLFWILWALLAVLAFYAGLRLASRAGLLQPARLVVPARAGRGVRRIPVSYRGASCRGARPPGAVSRAGPMRGGPPAVCAPRFWSSGFIDRGCWFSPKEV